jgi:hypothetical protein
VAEFVCFSSVSAIKGDHEVPAIRPLETLLVNLEMLASALKFSLEMIPDTGANVTAIPATAAPGIELHDPKIMLRAASGIPMRVVGTFHARISLQSNCTDEVVYVVRGLSRPLLSKYTMKELGLLHPDFPFQVPTNTSKVRSVPHEANTATQQTVQAPQRPAAISIKSQAPVLPGTPQRLVSPKDSVTSVTPLQGSSHPRQSAVTSATERVSPRPSGVKSNLAPVQGAPINV